VPAVFLVWSAFEYIFTLDGRMGPSLSAKQNPFEPKRLAGIFHPGEIPIPPQVRARLDFLADEWDRLSKLIDAAYASGATGGVEILEQQAERILAELEAASDELVAMPTEPGQLQATSRSLEGSLAELYVQFVKGDDRFRPRPYDPGTPQTPEGVFAWIARGVAQGRIFAHAGGMLDLSKVTDRQVLMAARDAYEQQVRYRRRLKGKQNPLTRKCGARVPRRAVLLHQTKSGHKLVLDRGNVRSYTRQDLLRHGLCPVIAGFTSPAGHRIARPGHEGDLDHPCNHAPESDLSNLARRLGMSLEHLERAMVHEGIAWHASQTGRAINPGRRGGWSPPTPEGCSDRMAEWRAHGGLDIHVEPDSRGSTNCDMAVLDFFYGGEVASTTEVASNVKSCSETSVRRSLGRLQRDGMVERVKHGQLRGRVQTAIRRANEKFWTITERGEQKVCANRLAFHRQAGLDVQSMSDEAMAAQELAYHRRQDEHAEVMATRKPGVPMQMTVTPQDFGRYVEFNAYQDGVWVGRLRLVKGPGDDRKFGSLQDYAAVADFVVHPSQSQEKIGRALYQAAALYARDYLEMTMASSVHRGMAQQHFWHDQAAKGSAAIHTYQGGDMRFARYALEEPVPDRLPNPRAKSPTTPYLIRATC
jgi:GNAT superfamily N-acetyltransferase